MYSHENATILGNESGTIAEKCFFLATSRHYEGFLYVESLLTAVMNLICAVVATSGNAIIIVTIWVTPYLHEPPHILLCCLAVADFTTGFIVQPTYCIHKFANILGNDKLDCLSKVIMESVAWVSAAVSCASYASISGERYLALHFHMRYIQIVTARRTLYYTGSCWVSMTLLSLSRFALGNAQPFIVANIVGITGSTITVLLAYWKIFGLVRYHHQKIRDQAEATQSGDFDIKKFRKSVNNIAYIVGVFILLYVPFTCVLIAQLQVGFTREIEAAYDCTRTMAFMASAINPFLYCWKMRDLREAVLTVVKKLRNTATIERSQVVTFHENIALSIRDGDN